MQPTHVYFIISKSLLANYTVFMIYTTLLEPYRLSTVIPLEVTVLRGARRLRLSTALRKKYADFTPRLWHLLSKLGYQKYLQKIYVQIDVDYQLTSPFYQLPMLIAILEAVGLVAFSQPVHVIGKFSADYGLYFPEVDSSETPFPSLTSSQGENGEKITSYLNKLHTARNAFHQFTGSHDMLFPGVVFHLNQIDIAKTPLTILKKIPNETIEQSKVYISYRKHAIQNDLLSFILSKPRPKDCFIEYKPCFCEQKKCTCTRQNRLIHDEQLYKIRTYWNLF